LRAAATLALLLAASLAVQFLFPQLIDSDGFFHIRMAERVLSGEMPWMPLSVFRHGWVDHQFLFHVLLWPFVAALPGGVVAAKLAAACFAALAAFAMERFLRSRGAPAPLLFAALPFALSWLFFLRMEMPRAQSLSLALLLATVAAMDAGRWRRLFALSWVFVWTYHVAFGLLPVALLHAGLRWRDGARGRSLLAGPAAVAGGLLAGLLVHPQSPRTLRFAWQHVVLKVWNREALPVGLEWTDGSLGQLLSRGGGGAAALAIAALLLARTAPGRRSSLALLLAVLAAGASALACVGTKFIEYQVPFSTLALALALRDHGIPERFQALVLRSLPASRLRHWAGAALLLLLAASGSRLASAVERTEPDPWRLAPLARELRRHASPGASVFHFSWNDLPELVFHAPEYRYVVGLDPHFLALEDPELWRVYEGLGGAWGPDRATPIRERFGAGWAVLVLPWPGAREALAADPGLLPVWEDGSAILYRVAPGSLPQIP
jgi:hypothetical protein